MDMKYALAGAFDFEDTNVTAIENEATFPTLDLITVNAPADDVEGTIPVRVHRRRQQRSIDRSRDSVHDRPRDRSRIGTQEIVANKVVFQNAQI